MATSLGRQLPNPHHLGTIIMSLMFKHVLPSEDSQKEHLLYIVVQTPLESMLHYIVETTKKSYWNERQMLLEMGHCHIPYNQPSQLQCYSPLPTPLETNSGVFLPKTYFQTSGHVLGFPLVILHFGYPLLY